MDESALELVRDWLARAGRDLRSARLLAAADDPPLDIAIYHCQQAAEKSIKAWLQGQDVPFPKTHDLLALVKRAAESHPILRDSTMRLRCSRPTRPPFAIQEVPTSRYPLVKSLMKPWITPTRSMISWSPHFPRMRNRESSKDGERKNILLTRMALK